MSQFLIIIPAFNEECNLTKVLRDIRDLTLNADVLVVNDGSTDNTAQIVKNEGVELISLPFNLGYGAALQTGFKYAVLNNYDYIIQFDADGQHDPEDLKAIVTELEKGEADIVIGSRFLGRGDFKAGFMKMLAIRMFRLLIRYFTKVMVTDPTSGLKGLTRRTFNYYATIGHYSPDFPDADILIQMILSRYNISEIPANIRKRKFGTSMHSGLKPMFYFVKVTLSILIVLLRKKFV